MKVDVLIIGGGPAGLTAAYEAASRGAKVAIVDESWESGGQLRQQTQVLDSLMPPFIGLRGYELAQKLISRLEPFAIDYYLKQSVIGVYADSSIGISDDKIITKVSASSIIVATGAAETPVAFPGWTLPGVMTTGAAQILINRERVYPGQTALLVGSSDLSLEVAAQMNAVGIQVLGIVEKSDRILAREQNNLDYLNAIKIPIHLNTEVTEVKGSGKGKKVVLGQGDNSNTLEYDVDFICVDGGRHPIIEPLAVLNCKLAYRIELGVWIPYYNTNFQSSVNEVFVAGNTSGVTSQGGFILTGAIAGIGAVKYLEMADDSEMEERRKSLWKELYWLESVKSPQIWEERVSHLGEFHGIMLPNNPVLWIGISALRRCKSG